MTESSRRGAEQHGISIEVDAGAEPLPLLADVGQMEQVFLNLVTNALDATDRGGRITLRARGEGAAVRFEVEDTGAGIAAAVKPRIFDPLFTTKAPGYGTGLGLPIVRDVVMAHGGSVEVDSEEGRGARFAIVLPSRSAEPAGASPPSAVSA